MLVDFIGLFCVRCSVVFLSCFVFGVCVVCGVVWCCLLFHWCVMRGYAVVVVLFSVLFFCFGLNEFPVCDCMLYIPYLRCPFLV